MLYEVITGRRIGDRGRRLVVADLLHLENIDGVLFGAEPEGEVLAARRGGSAGRASAACAWSIIRISCGRCLPPDGLAYANPPDKGRGFFRF